MLGQPLQPFHPPASLLSFLPSNISLGSIALWVLGLIFVFWAIYTLVAIYHWVKYSHASLIATPAIAVHLGVSFILIMYALSGTLFL
jgi:hypothetical protein